MPQLNYTDALKALQEALEKARKQANPTPVTAPPPIKIDEGGGEVSFVDRPVTPTTPVVPVSQPPTITQVEAPTAPIVDTPVVIDTPVAPVPEPPKPIEPEPVIETPPTIIDSKVPGSGALAAPVIVSQPEAIIESPAPKPTEPTTQEKIDTEAARATDIAATTQDAISSLPGLADEGRTLVQSYTDQITKVQAKADPELKLIAYTNNRVKDYNAKLDEFDTARAPYVSGLESSNDIIRRYNADPNSVDPATLQAAVSNQQQAIENINRINSESTSYQKTTLPQIEAMLPDRDDAIRNLDRLKSDIVSLSSVQRDIARRYQGEQEEIVDQANQNIATINAINDRIRNVVRAADIAMAAGESEEFTAEQLRQVATPTLPIIADEPTFQSPTDLITEITSEQEAITTADPSIAGFVKTDDGLGAFLKTPEELDPIVRDREAFLVTNLQREAIEQSQFVDRGQSIPPSNRYGILLAVEPRFVTQDIVDSSGQITGRKEFAFIQQNDGSFLQVPSAQVQVDGNSFILNAPRFENVGQADERELINENLVVQRDQVELGKKVRRGEFIGAVLEPLRAVSETGAAVTVYLATSGGQKVGLERVTGNQILKNLEAQREIGAIQGDVPVFSELRRAYQETDLPFGVKGTLEIVADPALLIPVFGTGIKASAAAAKGASAVTKALPGLPGKFVPATKILVETSQLDDLTRRSVQHILNQYTEGKLSASLARARLKTLGIVEKTELGLPPIVSSAIEATPKVISGTTEAIASRTVRPAARAVEIVLEDIPKIPGSIARISSGLPGRLESGLFRAQEIIGPAMGASPIERAVDISLETIKLPGKVATEVVNTVEDVARGIGKEFTEAAEAAAGIDIRQREIQEGIERAGEFGGLAGRIGKQTEESERLVNLVIQEASETPIRDVAPIITKRAISDVARYTARFGDTARPSHLLPNRPEIDLQQLDLIDPTKLSKDAQDIISKGLRNLDDFRSGTSGPDIPRGPGDRPNPWGPSSPEFKVYLEGERSKAATKAAERLQEYKDNAFRNQLLETKPLVVIDKGTAKGFIDPITGQVIKNAGELNRLAIRGIVPIAYPLRETLEAIQEQFTSTVTSAPPAPPALPGVETAPAPLPIVPIPIDQPIQRIREIGAITPPNIELIPEGILPDLDPLTAPPETQPGTQPVVIPITIPEPERRETPIIPDFEPVIRPETPTLPDVETPLVPEQQPFGAPAFEPITEPPPSEAPGITTTEVPDVTTVIVPVTDPVIFTPPSTITPPSEEPTPTPIPEPTPQPQPQPSPPPFKPPTTIKTDIETPRTRITLDRDRDDDGGLLGPRSKLKGALQLMLRVKPTFGQAEWNLVRAASGGEFNFVERWGPYRISTLVKSKALSQGERAHLSRLLAKGGDFNVTSNPRSLELALVATGVASRQDAKQIVSFIFNR